MINPRVWSKIYTVPMSRAHGDGADSRIKAGLKGARDIHGARLLEKYATMDAVITVTKNVKRTRNSATGAEVNYSGNAIKNGHLHH